MRLVDRRRRLRQRPADHDPRRGPRHASRSPGATGSPLERRLAHRAVAALERLRHRSAAQGPARRAAPGGGGLRRGRAARAGPTARSTSPASTSRKGACRRDAPAGPRARRRASTRRPTSGRCCGSARSVADGQRRLRPGHRATWSEIVRGGFAQAEGRGFDFSKDYRVLNELARRPLPARAAGSAATTRHALPCERARDRFLEALALRPREPGRALGSEAGLPRSRRRRAASAARGAARQLQAGRQRARLRRGPARGCSTPRPNTRRRGGRDLRPRTAGRLRQRSEIAEVDAA